MIRPDRPLSPQELDEAVHDAQRASSRGAGSWDETLVAVWRTCDGLDARQIARRLGGRADAGEIDAAIARVARRYPFRRLLKRAQPRLKALGYDGLLANRGLWRRAAFQLHAVDELPQRAIVERLGPAAEEAGVRLTEATLTGWIGHGRLSRQLAEFVSRETIFE